MKKIPFLLIARDPNPGGWNGLVAGLGVFEHFLEKLPLNPGILFNSYCNSVVSF